MRESSRRIAAASLGLTTIALVWIEEPLVLFEHNALYHWSGTALNLFAPVLLDVLIVWLVLALLMLSARAPGRWRAVVWVAIVFFTPLIALKSLHLLSLFMPSHWLSFTLLGSTLVAIVLVASLWRPAFTERFDRIVGFASTVLGFVALPGAFLLCQILWFGWQARSVNDPLPLHHSQTAAATEAKPRVIWILMDELSYQQVYEHRFPGLQLPAFDALAGQSTVFTQTIPAGIPVDSDIRTEKVVPALLNGEAIDTISSSASGQLSIRHPGTQKWQQFDQHNTVFQDAIDAGYRTAIVGWYVPYCRIMPAVTDYCFWTSNLRIENGMAPKVGVTTNMVEPVELLTRTGLVRRALRQFLKVSSIRRQDAEMHIEDYQKISAISDQVLRNPSLQFVLIHLPIPHPDGIYSRKTGQLTANPSTYIDNLALTDNYLTHFREVLEQTGQWDSSTVVIMGDHGWRTKSIWEYFPQWTQEEQKASLDGGFDDRPSYIVKLPGQQKGATIDTPFHAVETRKLLDALLTKKIQSQQDLFAWVQQTH